MRRVKLPGTGIETSALGFGCGPMLGRVGRRASQRALAAAWEHGVRYFDVARSYGLGEAESLLGAFLRERRSQVCLATKFGIRPPAGGRLLRPLKMVARRVADRLPRERVRALSSRALPVMQQRHFDVASARRSLAQSLAALQTDRIDVLLLHSCAPADLGNEELFRFLEDRVREGTVGCIGVSYEGDDLSGLLPLHRDAVRVLQVPADFRDAPRREILAQQPRALVSHSVFGDGGAGGGLRRVAEVLREDPAAARDAAERIGVDLRDRGALARLVLCDAFRANPRGVVLCSMFSPDHIAANAACADGGALSDAQLDAFRAWVGAHAAALAS